MNSKDTSRLRVAARAPARIDFGGGWTDVPPYCDREGGYVCNMAISRYASVTVSSAMTAREQPDPDDEPLVRAAVARAGLTGVTVRVQNDFPVGSGLGGSSAASAALLMALATWQHRRCDDRVALAELGRRIEVEDLGIPGGRQDHYVATHGGVLGLTFTTAVSVRRIPIADDTRRDLIRRAILIYTGRSRISGDTITAVLGAYEQRVPRVMVALRRMREIAIDMAGALEMGDVDSLGALLGEHWVHQRSLHESIPTPRIDEIVERAGAAGALGAKAMGASGGGCVLVIARSDRVDSVRRAVADLGDVLTFDMDSAGVAVTEGDA